MEPIKTGYYKARAREIADSGLVCFEIIEGTEQGRFVFTPISYFNMILVEQTTDISGITRNIITKVERED